MKKKDTERLAIKITFLFKDFFSSEKAAGFILIGCTILSLILANLVFGQDYIDIWHARLGPMSAEHWINDALMAVFFLLVGLEIERELYKGELANFRHALLPVMAALGGMAIPALIHYGFNSGTPEQSGFGIPMATDIAFALGILSLVGKRVPGNLKIFLTALAIIDDLGAILVIAIFYTQDLSFLYLSLSLGTFVVLFVMGKLGVNRLVFFLIPGIFMWYCMYRSGVHATISGVLLAFAIPFGKGDRSMSHRLQHFLHKPVAYFILPLFALANTGIILQKGFYTSLLDRNSLGIIAGLVIGKPLGIFGFSYLAIKSGLTRLPNLVKWKHILGAGMLGGIGFTMSVFITLLAFPSQEVIIESKIAILLASLLSAVLGLAILKSIKNRPDDPPKPLDQPQLPV